MGVWCPGGGFAWQYFGFFNTPDKSSCAATLRPLCAAGEKSPVYTSALMFSFVNYGSKWRLPPARPGDWLAGAWLE